MCKHRSVVRTDRQTSSQVGRRSSQCPRKLVTGSPWGPQPAGAGSGRGPAPLRARSRASGAPMEKSLADPLSLYQPILCPQDPAPSPALSQERAPGPCLPSAVQPRSRTAHTAKDEAEGRGAARLCVRVSPVDACEVPTLQRTARACGDQARPAAPGAQPRARGWPCGVSCLGLGTHTRGCACVLVPLESVTAFFAVT